ncbi:16004726-db33-4a42-994b-2f8df9aaff1b [Thermothielavioides terrestris]|uniref:thioredoxin-dependent peroxiredoxin n=2 Tax=Thermothielavioides terrestris TaxID=2587410 RepID=G2QTH3_THETT|nr:uncharacterized protein THITE_2109056 [Thermothielavioides terrestris NRRL 8126]AEO63590.1 hypothetical protein THITE_2109056 [Thermothielavioides terrestris NRRL 8126]SPQ20915.1 16004726-db33-4a42-994b-2f8df9aaff1b [Thermothielavioides terrestris]
MPMELRKRKAPAPPPAPAAKKPARAAKAASEAKEKVESKAAANGAANKQPAVGDTIALDGFGGEIETNDGTKTTLKALVEESKAGVVLFTYPKASTPGCTRQACLFRDAYDALTAASGLAIYGLSADSPKANTTFKEKQKLPYPLLCDPQATLIGAVGLRKAPKGTTRGVFVVDKAGRVLAAQAGSPEGTLKVVQEVVERLAGAGNGEGKAEAEQEGEKKKAEVGEAVEQAEKVEAEKGAEKPEQAAPGEEVKEKANGEKKEEKKEEEKKEEEKKEEK